MYLWSHHWNHIRLKRCAISSRWLNETQKKQKKMNEKVFTCWPSLLDWLKVGKGENDHRSRWDEKLFWLTSQKTAEEATAVGRMENWPQCLDISWE